MDGKVDGRAAASRPRRGATAPVGAVAPTTVGAKALARLHEGVFDPKLLDFEGESIRVVELPDGKLAFAVADLSGLINANVTDAVSPLASDEKGVLKCRTAGGPQDLVFVTEGGFYALVMRSHGAVSEGTKQYRFRRWTTDAVLPEIRRTGSYVGTRKTDPFGRDMRNAIADALGRYDLGHLDRGAIEGIVSILDEASGNADVVAFLKAMARVPSIGRILLSQEVIDRTLDFEEIVRHARLATASLASGELSRFGEAMVDGVAVLDTGEVVLAGESSGLCMVTRRVVDALRADDPPMAVRDDVEGVARIVRDAVAAGLEPVVWLGDFDLAAHGAIRVRVAALSAGDGSGAARRVRVMSGPSGAIPGHLYRDSAGYREHWKDLSRGRGDVAV